MESNSLLVFFFFLLLQCSRDAALDQNEKAYAEIILMADERRSAVMEQIAHQEKAALGRAESLVDRFEKEIKDLKKQEDELKQLSLTEDNIYFLQVRTPHVIWRVCSVAFDAVFLFIHVL